jgi:cytochrome b561
MQIMSRPIRQLSQFDAPLSAHAHHGLNLRDQFTSTAALEGLEPERRSHVSRILHLLLMLIVINQLAGSQFMEKPSPGEAAAWPFIVHEWVGIAGFVILTLFWLWAFLRHGSETSLMSLVPWLSASGWRGLLADLKRTTSDIVTWTAPRHTAALASAVHGLGLLAASAMAISGAAYFLVLAGTRLGGLVLELHKFVANFMWVYLIGHASMAIVHAILGSGVVGRMFWFKRSKEFSVEV